MPPTEELDTHQKALPLTLIHLSLVRLPKSERARKSPAGF
jgi:hypothetical protein